VAALQGIAKFADLGEKAVQWVGRVGDIRCLDRTMNTIQEAWLLGFSENSIEECGVLIHRALYNEKDDSLRKLSSLPHLPSCRN
jgi:hypothetical protein